MFYSLSLKNILLANISSANISSANISSANISSTNILSANISSLINHRHQDTSSSFFYRKFNNKLSLFFLNVLLRPVSTPCSCEISSDILQYRQGIYFKAEMERWFNLKQTNKTTERKYGRGVEAVRYEMLLLATSLFYVLFRAWRKREIRYISCIHCIATTNETAATRRNDTERREVC